LLTDKTGTLTKNDMIFKKLNLEFAAFDLESLLDVKNMLRDVYTKYGDAGPMSDLIKIISLDQQNLDQISSNPQSLSSTNAISS